MCNERIENVSLREKIVSAEIAASFIEDGMVVGMSGFTRAGDAKEVPLALARRAATHPLKISLLTGASLGHDIDKILCEAGVIARRMPFQVDTTLRAAINRGEVMFIDEHLSEVAESLRGQQLPPIDCAIIEAVAIKKDGGLVLSSSIGNTPIFLQQAKKIIIEVNKAFPMDFEGVHDIYLPAQRPGRPPVEVLDVRTRIGSPYMAIDIDKVVAVVVTDKADSPSTILPPDAETVAIGKHLIDFFEAEMRAGRLTHSLAPIQAGIGTIANAVLMNFAESNFHNLTMYSEVLQDSTFDLFDAGKLDFASACSITLSEQCAQRVFHNMEKYKDRLVLRPQEISNFPEIIRRLGIITINTALEFDIYGNVNSTHVNGTHMMNGLGGSGDFARNAFISIFVTKSTAKGGKLSSVVPMVAHTDHTEHDVDVLVTEIGLADLRGLAPRERALSVIENCVHPSFKDKLHDYFVRACHTQGGQTPHLLEEALSWHAKALKTGSMV